MKGSSHDGNALAPTAPAALCFRLQGIRERWTGLAISQLLAFRRLHQRAVFCANRPVGGKFENRDMGGVLQFTTGLGVGWKPRLQSSLYVGLRMQHISNGSIHEHNPGMDVFGLELVWIPER